MMPQHMNFRFFDMTPLPTFAAYDVMKNPKVEADFARFDAHLAAHLGPESGIVEHVAAAAEAGRAREEEFRP